MQPEYKYRATLNRVIDGDSYVLSVDLGFKIYAALTIRLLHIDVYEHNTQIGQQATKFVTDLLTGQELIIQTQKDEQTFARYLADIWVHDALLSDTLKQAGFAKPDSPWNKNAR